MLRADRALPRAGCKTRCTSSSSTLGSALSLELVELLRARMASHWDWRREAARRRRTPPRARRLTADVTMRGEMSGTRRRARPWQNTRHTRQRELEYAFSAFSLPICRSNVMNAPVVAPRPRQAVAAPARTTAGSHPRSNSWSLNRTASASTPTCMLRARRTCRMRLRRRASTVRRSASSASPAVWPAMVLMVRRRAVTDASASANVKCTLSSPPTSSRAPSPGMATPPTPTRCVTFSPVMSSAAASMSPSKSLEELPYEGGSMPPGPGGALPLPASERVRGDPVMGGGPPGLPDALAGSAGSEGPPKSMTSLAPASPRCMAASTSTCFAVAAASSSHRRSMTPAVAARRVYSFSSRAMDTDATASPITSSKWDFRVSSSTSFGMPRTNTV